MTYCCHSCWCCCCNGWKATFLLTLLPLLLVVLMWLRLLLRCQCPQRWCCRSIYRLLCWCHPSFRHLTIWHGSSRCSTTTSTSTSSTTCRADHLLPWCFRCCWLLLLL